jgi:citrate synthase
MSEKKTATLTLDNGKSYTLPVMDAVEGPSVIDISALYKDSGYFTFDPGFLSTASCESAITYIDGDEGILRYRGYDIKDLAEKRTFLDVSHLLLYGDLPEGERKEWFDRKMMRHTMVNEQLQFMMRGFPRRSHPMAIMVGAAGSLSAFYHDSLNMMKKNAN